MNIENSFKQYEKEVESFHLHKKIQKTFINAFVLNLYMLIFFALLLFLIVGSILRGISLNTPGVLQLYIFLFLSFVSITFLVFESMANLLYLKRILKTMPESFSNKMIKAINFLQIINILFYPINKFLLNHRWKQYFKKLKKKVPLKNNVDIEAYSEKIAVSDLETSELLNEVDQLLFGDKVDLYDSDYMLELLLELVARNSYAGTTILAELYFNYYDGVLFPYNLDYALYYACLSFKTKDLNDEKRADLYIMLSQIYVLIGNENIDDNDENIIITLMVSYLLSAKQLGHEDADRLLNTADESFDLNWDYINEHYHNNYHLSLIDTIIENGISNLNNNDHIKENIENTLNSNEEDIVVTSTSHNNSYNYSQNNDTIDMHKITEEYYETKKALSTASKYIFFGFIFLLTGIGVIIHGAVIQELYSPALYLLGLLIMGLPNLKNSFVKSVKTDEAWSKVTGSKYRIVFDDSKNSITVSKERDVFFIFFKTILNLISSGISFPFIYIKFFNVYLKTRKSTKKLESYIN